MARMRNKFLEARACRDRAGRLRAIADDLVSDRDRNFLTSMASDYERMADSAERQGRFAQVLEIRP